MREDDIERFVEAQNGNLGTYALALEEIRNGRKTSHWMWYVFPQLRGLGHSYAANFFGLSGREEAEAYLRHPVLGPRLREISEALLAHSDKTADAILGGIDTLKLFSCMTLFDSISPNDIFARVLDQFYQGRRDSRSQV